ncbi:hypothetical protein KCU78_g3908, partial [Aureobasidium melanogenum]
MQELQQPSSSILTTAYNFLIRGTRFFANLCARRSEKKRQAYDWEERLAYVGAEVEDEDDEISDDEHDMQLERSCGVAREVPDMNMLEIRSEGSGITKHITIARLLYQKLFPPPYHLLFVHTQQFSTHRLAVSQAPPKKQEPRSRQIFTQKVHTTFPNMIGLIISILKFFAWLLGFGVLGPIRGGLAACFQSVFGTPWLFRVLQRFAMMSKQTQCSILKQQTLDHYDHLCAAHGIRPTASQTGQIKEVVRNVAKSAARRSEYGLLYFVPRSAVVMKNNYHNYLLVGWINKPDGSREETWFAHHGHRGHLYHEDGRVLIHSDREAPICDEWHPSIDEICQPWQAGGRLNRNMLFALLGATHEIMTADTQTPSFEDTIATNPDTRSGQGDTLIETEDNLARSSSRRESLSGEILTHGEPSNTSTMSTIGATFLEEDRTKKARGSVVVDLIESDSEESSGPESSVAPLTTNRHDHQPIPLAKQKLFEKLQSKKVHEIEDMLAKRAGLLPEWVEKTMRQEMEKKMNRNLETIENWF